MKLIMAQTCEWHRTERYLYTTEVREYQTTKYQIRTKFIHLCTVFKTKEEAEDELARMLRTEWKGQTGWVESYEWPEFVTLHHRYTIRKKGR